MQYPRPGSVWVETSLGIRHKVISDPTAGFDCGEVVTVTIDDGPHHMYSWLGPVADFVKQFRFFADR